MQSGNLNIAVEVDGEGAPVLLLHGWGTNMQSFASVRSYLLKQGKKVIAIDFPGFGGSDAPKEVWGVADYAKLVADILLQLNIDTCDVIAHSFGGRVVILLCALKLYQFRRIVITGGAGILPIRTWRYHLRVFRYKIGKKIANIRWIKRMLHLDEKMKNAGSEDYRILDDHMKKVFIKVVNQDLTPYLKQIDVPTLLIWGSADESTPLYMGKIMEKEIPDAGLVVFEGASHYAFLDEYQRFCMVISSFLGGSTWK